MKCPKCSFDNPGNSIFCSRCGSRLEPSTQDPAVTQAYVPPFAHLQVGSVLDERYQIIEELGRGGMGRVYKALDVEIDEKIAIKVLNPEISSDAKTIERFRNELKVARKIRHKHVCQMYDLEKSSGMYFITMEYVSGEDLKSTVNRLGQLSEGKSIIIAKQICKGLAEAHNRGIVHRDMKPQNIMIDRAGDVRIMDFGIARSQMSAGLTETGAMIGTPEYMSPEQAVGEEIDKRSDIYSLGIILYELATGRTPFKGDTAVSVALKHKTETPPAPIKYNETMNPRLNNLILKCLEKDRKNRPQDINEILKEMVAIEEGISITDKVIPDKPTSMEKPSKAPKAKKAKKPFPKYAIPGFAALAVLAVLAVWLAIPKGGDNQAAAENEEQGNVVVPTTEVTLSLSSEPPGAMVYLGMDQLGETPLEKAVDPGTYTLRLEKDGYETLEETVDIDQDLTRTFTLVEAGEVVPAVGTLEVTSIPEGAEVFVNEENRGTTPLSLELEEGTYQLSIVNSGYEPKNEEVIVEAGQVLNKQYLLDQRSVAYVLEVTSEPPDARVYIDGNFRGRTPLRNLELAQATGFMRVRKDGWGYKDFNLNLNEGTNKQHVVLEQETFRLSVSSDPSEAQVFLNDRELGVTPLTRSLSPGSYNLRIIKEGYRTEDVSVLLDKDLDQSFAMIPLAEISIQIKVRPKANVLLDGQLQREVPPTLNLDVKVGRHRLEFVEPDTGKRYATTLEFKPNESWELRMFMEDGRLVQIDRVTGEQKELQLKISQ